MDHRTLAPNSETLPTLDLPIHIFHGVYDGNTPVEGVYDVQSRFEALGKDAQSGDKEKGGYSM